MDGLSIEYHRRRAQLILTELELAMTFLALAGTTQDPETAARDLENAKTAYGTATKWLSEGAPYTDRDKIEELVGKVGELLGGVA
jgi:hypothetical protein